MSDFGAAARAVAGDRRALDDLWREHRRWVATVLLAHKPRIAELDDLLQEVAVILVERVTELRDPRRLRPWLRRVAVNVARGAGRRQQSRPVDALPGPAEGLVDPSSEVGAVADRERLAHVLATVGRLPAEQREPLLLKALHGLTQLAIAELLDVPETTVETRLARARRDLRQRLDAPAPPRATGTDPWANPNVRMLP